MFYFVHLHSSSALAQSMQSIDVLLLCVPQPGDLTVAHSKHEQQPKNVFKLQQYKVRELLTPQAEDDINRCIK